MSDPYPTYTTKYGTAFEKISCEVEWYCARCTKPCEKMKCLAYRIEKIIAIRDQKIRDLNVDDLFEKDESQLTLFDE